MTQTILHKIGAGVSAAAALAAFASAPVQAAGAERSLAGIAIFAPGSSVTKKFGNPNQILVGGVAPPPFSPAGASGGPGGAGGGYPGAQGGGQGGYPGASSSSGGFPGGGGGFPGGGGGYPGAGGRGEETGSLPGFPGGGSPGGFSGGGGFPGSGGGFPGGASGFPGGGAAAIAPVKPPVTLVYNRANGGSLEFTISPDKRVVQIRETGYLGAYGTTRGIKLGTSYSAVVARYGYPENTDIAGPIINIDYRSTLHCGFQFLDQKPRRHHRVGAGLVGNTKKNRHWKCRSRYYGVEVEATEDQETALVAIP